MSERVSEKIERAYSFEYTTQVKLVRELIKKKELKNALRILIRLVCEHDRGTVLLVKNEAHLAGYGVLRNLPAKYRFGSSDDYMLGPYFVYPEFRKHGLGYTIVDKLWKFGRGTIWAYVMSANVASQRTLIKCDFVQYSNMQRDKRYYRAIRQ